MNKSRSYSVFLTFKGCPQKNSTTFSPPLFSRRKNPGGYLLFVFLLLSGGSLISCRPVESDSTLLVNLLSTLRPDSRDRTILIIGDSLTDYSMGFHLPSLVSPDFTIYYNGKKGYDFPMWSAVIEEAFSIPSPPGHVVVALGTNDALHNGTRDFLTNLQNFHTKLRARTSARVYYCMMPLTIQPELISFISQNNDVLRRTPLFANTEKIDLESAFSTAPSYPYLYNLDLIHPTEAGYMIIGGRVVDAVTH